MSPKRRRSVCGCESVNEYMCVCLRVCVCVCVCVYLPSPSLDGSLLFQFAAAHRFHSTRQQGETPPYHGMRQKGSDGRRREADATKEQQEKVKKMKQKEREKEKEREWEQDE